MRTYAQIFRDLRQRIGASIGGIKPAKPIFGRSGYTGGRIDRLSADWNLSQRTSDAEIQQDIIELRNRCRDLGRNDAWVSRALNSDENNILTVGKGFSLQMRCAFPPNFEKLDKNACLKIEQAWAEWCKPKNCTITGEDSFYDICRQTRRARRTDGGIMFRKIEDEKINKFGFALQPIEIDYLDHCRTEVNGNRYIVMGVEKMLTGLNAGKTIAYWLMDRHPGDILMGGRYFGASKPIPADQIIHYFVKERVTQSLGVPSIAPVIERLRHLGEYEKAELVASREASNKGGYFTSDRGGTYSGEVQETSSGDPTGSVLSDSSPGQNDDLPPGMSFVPYDPTHPTQQYGDFVKNALFGVSAGLELPYMVLTGDLSNANYSSMRAGNIEAQEGFKKEQYHMIEHLCIPIFDAWLEAALLNRAIDLPYSKIEQFNRPRFTGRRWPWVDPEKDIRANLMAIDGGVYTRTMVTEEQGLDFEDICQQLEDEKDVAEDHDLEFVTPQSSKTTPPGSDNADIPSEDVQSNKPTNGQIPKPNGRARYHFSS